MKTFYVALLIVAIVGGWWLLKSRNIDVFGQAASNKYSAGIVQSATDLWNAAKNRTVNFFSQKSNEVKQSADKALDAAKQKGQEAIEAQKQSLVDRAKGETDSFLTAAINDVRGFLGLAPYNNKLSTGLSPSATGTASRGALEENGNEAALLGAVVKRGEPLTFVISNAFFKKYGVSDISYDVAWGDGDTEHHVVYADAKNKFITHTFARVGEYAPYFTFTVGANKIQYTITVVVQ